MKFKVFITWKDGTKEEFESGGISYLEAEETLLNSFTSAARDGIATYWSEEIDEFPAYIAKYINEEISDGYAITAQTIVDAMEEYERGAR